jgi:DNA-directed RNA polymerase specialized sigma24 family protein
MFDPSANTPQLINWLDRMRAGDLAARDELIRGFQGRLELLARKMLLRDPRLARWTEPDDVLQGVLMRLLRALQSVQPDSTRAFFGLAAEHIRRELLERVRTTTASRHTPTRAARVSTHPPRTRMRTIWNGGLDFTRRWRGCRNRSERWWA